MRLFVAVDVDAASRRAVERLQAGVRNRHPAADRALRWVDPANLHLTLRFLGEVPDPAPVERALTAPFRQRSFTLGWSAPAWLPPRGRPRVFHLAVGEGADPLRALAQEVDERLDALGFAPEERLFTAHLTLARVRDGADAYALRHLAEPALPEAPAADLRVNVDAVVLYESRLSPRGSTYAVRHRSQLAR